MASTQIYRTPASSGNDKTFTVSTWLKRTKLGAEQFLMRQYETSSLQTTFQFESNDELTLIGINSGTTKLGFNTKEKFRDIGAWYHIVCAVDTTRATASERQRLWVNGNEITDFSTETAVTENAVLSLNETVTPYYLGSESGSNYFEGCMSHYHYIDGTGYTASDFGEFDSTSGIWKITISPSVTYGTNGFFLKFEDSSNMDLDSGTNAFTNFTTSGTLTATKDNPSNNFCILNSLSEKTSATYTYSNANTTADITGGWLTLPLTLGAGAGKWYFEAKLDTLGNYAQVGWASSDFIDNGGQESYFGVDSSGVNLNSSCGIGQDGPIYNSTTAGTQASTAYGSSYGAGTYISCALDLDNNFAYWAENGVWQNSGVPTSGATGTGAFTIDNPTAKGYLWVPGVAAYTAKWSINTGNGYFGTTLISSPEADDGGVGAFKYDVPAGYRAFCTTNIKAYGG